MAMMMPPQQQGDHHPQTLEEVRTLWIGDLQYWVDENYLTSCFSQTGELVSVKVIRNKITGQPEGYGFIEFVSHAAAERTLQTYNGTLMPGTEVAFRLNWASFGSCQKVDAGPDHPIFVGDLAPDVTDYLLHETFRVHYSSVRGAKVVTDSSTGRSKRYGFVNFADESERNKAISEMNGLYCSTRPMRIGAATRRKTVGVQQQYVTKAAYPVPLQVPSAIAAPAYVAQPAQVLAPQIDITCTTKNSHSVNIMCSETVRYAFVSHLSGALRRQGISVSVFTDTDDSELKTYSFPDDQSQGARVSVVVFSESYASSIPWFAKHLERHKNNDYVIVPVFYGVDPSVVNRDFECLRTLTRNDNITGHQSGDSELVEEIVRDVFAKLCPTERIGIYSRLLDIENLLCEQPWDIRSLGIWGMPGIGKTTLAKALFEQIHIDYDASCFIENFDEALYKAGPQRLLEEQIFKVVMEKFGASTSYITRLSLLKDKLCDTRILLVLDDVRNPLVAESFLARFDWFGPGSLIIVTSRYKQVFAHCQVNDIYRVQGLNEQEALQLFSQTVFEKDVPEQNDRELSLKVIDYANGNPLALSIYGQILKRKKSSTVESAFLGLKQCPPAEIQDMLKGVYSTLGDNEKHIFLSIACFFKGESVDYIAELLKGCGYFPRVGIDILVDKCMMVISENILQMNDLIQDIFRHIVTGDRIQMKKCTTLWQPSSIRYLLEEDEHKGDDQLKETPKSVMVTKDTQGISLDTSNLTFSVNPDAFKNMTCLRFLKIYSSHTENVHGLKFPKGLNFLPSKLRLFHWENYSFESLREDFNLGELVELNMPYSQLKELTSRTENLEKLKRVGLRHSQQLIEFSIHENAQNIEMIDLQGCTRLESFPAMTKLQHLQVLNLSGCSNIKTLPGLPPNIEELYLQGTSIEELPKSVVGGCSQPNFEELMNHRKSFRGFEHIDMDSVTNLIKVSSYSQGFCKLVRLDMKDCLHLRSLLDMFNLESLQVLDLSGCSSLEEIKGFPKSIKELYLAGTRTRELPEFPESLEVLNAHDCGLLKTVRLNSKQLPRHYTFSNCFSLSSETTAEFLEKFVSRVIMLAKEENQEHIDKAHAFNICFPADKCHSTFFHWREGSCVTVELTPRMQKAVSGFAMSVLVSFPEKPHDLADLGIMCTCTWGNKKGHFGKIERVFKCWAPTEAPSVEKDHMFVFYDSEIHPGAADEQTDSDDDIIFEFHTVSGENKLLGTTCKVKECGVKVITPPEVDKLVSGRESEAISIVEEDTKPEEKSTSVTEEDTPLFSRDPEEKSTSVAEEDTSLFPREPEIQGISVNEEETLPFPREPEKKSLEKKNRERQCVPPMASFSSSSCSKPPEDQVFINFRREELRYSFISYLSNALERNGINAFIDTDENMGQHLNVLLDRIERSKIALAIFSQGYTESDWCLKELAKMRERMEEGKLVVIPIFYKVEPATVKRQRGEFGDKFRDLVECLDEETKNKWTEALTTVSLLTGLVLDEKSDENYLIDRIVKEVTKALNNTSRASPPSSEGTDLSLPVHKKKVESSCGTESRVKQLEEKLSFGSEETSRTIGVVGTPGIGKSTLVKKFYEKSKNRFLRHVFLPDVHQTTKDYGLSYLPTVLLEDLLKVKSPRFENVQAAHEGYKDQLLRTKTLVVLDNVSDKEQILAILGKRDWIKQGSQIVIATSDKSLVHEWVDDIYEVPPLSYQHSLQHFSHYAFGGESNDSSFLNLSKDFVHYTKGNPLALKVLGHELRGKDEGHWYSKLDALRQYHKGRERISTKMHQSLWKESYDALNQQQKDTLLDIACFSSLDVNYVASLLDSYRDARSVIEELVHKFLITISGDKIEMHDTLHMFCKELGQEAYARDGIGRRRLWDHDKIINVLDTNKGASGIRSIVLDLADVKMRSLHSQAFVLMRDMRYLQIYNTDWPHECDRDLTLNFPDGLQLPLWELRCLHWLKFPLRELPPDFNPQNLVDLKLPYSEIERVWEGDKDARILKWIDFNHSRKLCTLSGLAEARNLQELNLEGCTALETLPQDMENMKCLVYLNLRGCTNLKCLPEISLISLQILILANCSRFKVFHVISEKLEVLNISGCSRLKEIKGLPRRIKELYLAGTRIRELPELPESLEVLNAHDCYHLKSVRLDFKQLPRHYTFSNCFSLSSETTAEFLEKGVTRVIMSATEENQEYIKAPRFNICFAADACPSTNSHMRAGSFVTVERTPCTQKALSGFAMSVLVSFRDNLHNAVGLGIRCVCTWGTKKGHFGRIERVFKCWAPTEAPRVEKDHVFVFYDSEMQPGDGEKIDSITSDDEIEFEFHTVSGENKLLGPSCMVIECGVQIITAPAGDKLVSGITRESEARSIKEDTPLLPRTPEAKSISVIEEDTPLFPREAYKYY